MVNKQRCRDCPEGDGQSYQDEAHTAQSDGVQKRRGEHELDHHRRGAECDPPVMQVHENDCVPVKSHQYGPELESCQPQLKQC